MRATAGMAHNPVISDSQPISKSFNVIRPLSDGPADFERGPAVAGSIGANQPNPKPSCVLGQESPSKARIIAPMEEE